MRRVIVGAFVSMDGVMQAPGGPYDDIARTSAARRRPRLPSWRAAKSSNAKASPRPTAPHDWRSP